ncbi:reverse transcriptase (RNA-dependent DNA polymerase) domain-containing protein [Phthorimaea operculella]|nr:reverse transcriptase (RNA-dependent DNA polymerase) domain-containing protein [Phthorimaea operculella]
MDFDGGRSTATALAQFTDDVNGALDQHKQVVVVYIDFRKAFDTLEHNQLIQAMEECGIAGPLSNWLRAYLTDRYLQTVVDKVTGDPARVSCGVPTGSVYGPVGYIMHVNSMCNVVKNCCIYMYADDTCLLYADKDLNVIERKLQQDFTNIIKWAHDNGIVINISKTKCMLIRSPHLKAESRAPRIIGHSYYCLHNDGAMCDCAELEVVQHYKYLGLVIENKFSWKKHIGIMCDKLRAVLVKLRHLSYVLDRATMYVVYFALVDSIISYGLGSYGQTFKTYLNKIKSLQKRFMKLLVDKKVKARCKDSDYEQLFIECKMLPVHEKFALFTIVEQFGCDEFKICKIGFSEKRIIKH